MAKDVIITPADGDIQFKNSSGTETGKIEQSGNDLVISNAVGDVLIGDGSSDVYIGDGTNNVDIIFEQNGAIKGETGAGVTLTLGSSDTTLDVSASSIVVTGPISASGAITGSDVKIDNWGSISASLATISASAAAGGGGGGGSIDGSGAANKVAIWSDSDTLTSDTNLHWDSSNDRLGIGTSSPSVDLDIENTTGVTIDLNSSSGDGKFRFQDAGVLKWTVGRDNTNQNFAFSSGSGLGNGDVLTLTTTGFVGIGTSSPSTILDIQGDNPILELNDSNSTIRYAALKYLTAGGTWYFSSGDSNTGAGVANSDLWITRNATGTNNRFRFHRDSYAFSIYSGSNQNISLDANGNSYFNGGNVGIDTTSPQATLSIGDNIGAFNGLSIGGSANRDIRIGQGTSYNLVIGWKYNSTATSAYSIIENYNGNNPLILQGSGGNVGIGTTSPSYKLDVAGNANISSSLHVTGSVGIANSSPSYDLEIGQDGDGERDIRIHSDASNAYFEISTRGNIANLKANQNQNLRLISTGGGGYVTIATGGDTERFRVNYDGKVGIGTTSPNSKLEVVDSITFSNVDTFGQFTIKSTSGTTGDMLNFGVDDTNNVSFIQSNNRGTSTLPLTLQRYGGNVGIGTTSPTQKLEVREGFIISSGSGVSDTGFVLDRAGLDTYELRHMDGGFTVYNSTETRKEMSFNGAGRIGIGTTAPTRTLTVSGSISASGDIHIDNNQGLVSKNVAGSERTLIELDSSNTLKIKGNDSEGSTNVITMVAGGDVTFPADVTVQGTVTAQEFHTEFISASIIYQSGSTKFGDDIDDVHNFTGSINLSGSINLEDNAFLYLGDSSDLQLYHNGTNSVITNYTGHLYIGNNADDSDIIFQSDDGSGGITEYFRLDGSSTAIITSKNNQFTDNTKLLLGSSNDLKIYHNGTNSVFENTTGNLSFIQYADDSDIIFQSDDGSGGVTTYFRLDGSLGYTVASKQILVQDNVKLSVGTSEHGIVMVHDGSNSTLSNAIGDLTIQNFANDKDIIFKSDDGSGGVTEYFRLDGGETNVQFEKNIKLNNEADIYLSDNGKTHYGDSNDLEIFHDGSNSNITAKGTGHLYIQQTTDDKDIIFRSDDGSGGITTYFQLDGSNERLNVDAPNGMLFSDNIKLKVGTGGDLEFYHNGTNSVIESNTNDLIIKTDNAAGNILFQSGSTEFFRLNGSSAITRASKSFLFVDNAKGIFGDGSDLQIYHNGTDSFINNDTGHLFIKNFGDDNDIVFQTDDGSGGTAEYFRLDGGATIVVVNKEFRFVDNIPLKLGSGPDLEMVHNGTNTNIVNSTGDLTIENTADDKDIIFKSDDGSGGTTEYFRLDGSEVSIRMKRLTKWDDNIKATFGDGSDLQIYHDSSDSYIDDTGTGRLYVRGSGVTIGKYTGENGIIFNQNAEVKLYYDNSGKLETTATGVTVTGDIDADDITVDNWGSVSASLATISASAAAGGGGSAVQVSVGQYTSTDTSTDINTGTATVIPFNSTDGVTDTSNYSISAGRVTVSEAGTYWVVGQVSYTGAVTRANIGVSIFKNGTDIGYQGNMGYLRDSTGHNEASSIVSAYVDVSANDIIDIRGIQKAAAGTVNLASGESVFALNKVGGAVPASNTFADARSDTGTALDLQYSGGSFYSMGSASSTTSYTTGSVRVGGWAKVFVNASSKPTVGGSTEMDSSNSGFTTSTDCYLVATYDGSNARHFFTKV